MNWYNCAFYGGILHRPAPFCSASGFAKSHLMRIIAARF